MLRYVKRCQTIFPLFSLIGKYCTSNPADWIGIYGKVALTGEPIQFENHAESLGKCYKVSAYCPEKSYFVALFEDITESKKAQKALKDSEENYRHLLLYAPT
jgi:hypothetical protein